ncbi:PREDICTED: uncharacterized protein LOC107073262 isoform X3 [Polistes dominula]|uniref:Uncharacterized protein LOC107073262 isoform X3 n=1 Tax=Polistes dominula TaxID=743375 RepID=A0ABM1JA25_POLDO|nr:PREDICTED: uncharacterized protein LOC107073262 isoform X3 [Polistes dominula]
MTSKNVDLAKHHFLFSSFLFQFLTNQRPNRNSKDQLLLFSAIIVYLLPVVVILIMEYSELSKNIIDRIEFSMYVIGSFFTIYINFYLGQKLLNYSNAVFAELCNIPFYTISKNTQKLLLFMLMRSGKPSFLSIGNMFISSHEVFASLMRKAFSFAMVYYNVE